MQLKEKNGIACDCCGTSYRNDFDYLSFDFHVVRVTDNRRIPIEQIIKSNVALSLDVCTSCFDGIKTRVVENYKKVMSPKRRASAPVICDWTGNILSGSYTYYYCNITSVQVRLTGQTSYCVGCNTKTLDEDKPCAKCSGTNFNKLASVNTQDRYLELVLSLDAVDYFTDKAKTVRKIAGEWSTST